MAEDEMAEAALWINLSNVCELFHVLPEAGGLLDQDAFTVLNLMSVIKANSERQQREDKKAAAKRGG